MNGPRFGVAVAVALDLQQLCKKRGGIDEGATEISFSIATYREVQLDLTPEIEVFHMLFKKCHTKK